MSGRKANGRSSIFLGKDGRWHGYVTMGVKDNGKTDRRHVQAATEKAVTAKVVALEKKRDAGSVMTVGKVPTVAEWLTYWLENIAEQKVRPSTLQGYHSKVTTHLIPGLGEHRLDRLQPEHLERFYAACSRKGLAPATILQMHRILSRALKVAMQRERIARNVCTLVDAPSVSREEVQPLSGEDARAILDVARGRRNAARWSVALALGLRQGEALGLMWDYVDLDAGTLRVRWQLQRLAGRGLVLVEPKSRAGRRTIALPAQLVDALREHRSMQDAERETAGELWDDAVPTIGGQQLRGLVFAQVNGRPLDPRRDWQDWKDLLAAAGVRDARLHDARHTSASLLLAEGVPARVVMELLGHSQISLTLGTYSHVAPEVSRVAADRIGGRLWD
ncbi:tyrosine-type recombinase/integrase [Actinoplanes teichomyceticus]|uniref:Site-specific recombinase XerD n=1 Tax=Actinoplanes teichomyceticus TaxID=1867 RepID=A0A561WI96_ACTTI|nr:site-specific integrase [Actinoplanes teichomyceticus]TWG23575.1 site-specific recombinase XerD [Actinoplanes teichomyceticus]GIF16201.1 site-specific integrase [Actinoplanes teichomyceticus]